MRTEDRLLLGTVRIWSLLRHPGVWRRSLRNKAGFFPNPAAPAADGDKFLWRKIFDHNPLFSVCCDKLAAKDYAKRHSPGLKTAAVLWQGTDPARIPAELLAGNVAIKANHGSGWNILVRDGQYDRKQMLRRTSSWVRRTYARFVGEWGYRNARRCLLVEAMLQEPDGRPAATEYKFHTSAGRICYVYVKRRNADSTDNWCFYDGAGTPMPADPAWTKCLPLPLPDNFPQMREVAEKLGQPFDHMRVDLYSLAGDIYFSELTVYPQSGKSVTGRLAQLRNADWDLRKSWFLTTPQRGWRRFYAAALRRWLDEVQPVTSHSTTGRGLAELGE